jgi:Tfp pilus assembly protein PilV
MKQPRQHRAPRPEQGFSLTDILVGMTLLAISTISLTNLFIGAMGQGKNAGVAAHAAVWAQAETDYLRSVGYGSSCLAAGITTITSTSSGCTVVQPPLPIEFPTATVQVEDTALGMAGLKRVTVLVYRPTGIVYYRVVTYVAQTS